MFSFEVIAKEGDARVGRLVTPRGVIETPSFVSVGTLATVKAEHLKISIRLAAK